MFGHDVLVIGQMEINLKDMELFETLDSYSFLLSDLPKHLSKAPFWTDITHTNNGNNIFQL